MPELNNDAPGAAAQENSVSRSAVSEIAWPELAASDGPLVADPAVRTILEQVRVVPGLPVSEHPEAYAGLHDALLEALDEQPHQEPRPGPGAA
jgi:hypothetical protein